MYAYIGLKQRLRGVDVPCHPIGSQVCLKAKGEEARRNCREKKDPAPAASERFLLGAAVFYP